MGNILLLLQNNWRVSLIFIIIIITCIFQAYTLKLSPNYIKYQELKLKNIKKENFTSDIPKYMKFINELKVKQNALNPAKITNYNISYITSEDAFSLYNNNTYINTMNSINIKARQHTNKALCINTYMNSIVNISLNEQKDFNNFINYIVDILKKNKKMKLIKFLIDNLKKSKIGKGTSWLEYNMPHTHKNIIIFPQYWFDNITTHSKPTLYNSGGTLFHELIHINQRKNMDIYNKIYKLWNFHKVTYFDNMNELLNVNRHNPDGIDIKWVWKNPNTNLYYWVSAIFNSKNPINLSDVTMKAYPVYKLDTGKYKKLENQNPYNLNEFNDYYNYFCIRNNHYHPNEIIAEYMETYYHVAIGMRAHLNCPGYKIFLQHIKQILKN